MVPPRPEKPNEADDLDPDELKELFDDLDPDTPGFAERHPEAYEYIENAKKASSRRLTQARSTTIFPSDP